MKSFTGKELRELDSWLMNELSMNKEEYTDLQNKMKSEESSLLQ